MDLSACDVIHAHYDPCEREILDVLRNLCGIKNTIGYSFIDVAPRDYIQDPGLDTLITDQLISPDLYPGKKILRLPDSIFGIYFIPEPVQTKPIVKDFNLFINRACAIRLFYFYKIIEMEMLDQGFVSYIGCTERTTDQLLGQKAFVDFLHHQFFSPNYPDQFQFARDAVPYQNFYDCGDLRKIMVQTKFSIVMETYHDRPDAVSFSEKIFRALQVPRPWLLAGASGSVDRLRSLGFDVFDDYVDHRYDTCNTEYDTVQRDALLLEQVTKLRSLAVTESVLHDWNRRYEHNMSILSSWHTNWRQDLQEFLSKNFASLSISESLA
jgi:hypothetical protein